MIKSLSARGTNHRFYNHDFCEVEVVLDAATTWSFEVEANLKITP
ncbi:MAG: hypothetical protein ABWX70_09810 [Hyphomicrobium sp.]